MSSEKDRWVAGVYIRERTMSFVVGTVDFTGVADEDSKVLIPKTTDRAPIDDLYNTFDDPNDYIRAGAELLRSLDIDFEAVHVSCFGAFSDTQRRSKNRPRDYGKLNFISPYPAAWHEVNVYRPFASVLAPKGKGPTITVGTNASAAAFGEFHYECGKGGRNAEAYTLVCLNFSRTITAGIVRNGELWEGASAPLVSVIRPRRFTAALEGGGVWYDLYQGNCKYHKDCIEGLAGANALSDRCGIAFNEIPFDHPVWDIFVHYAAQLCVTVTGLLSPNAIVLTGRCVKQLENRAFARRMLSEIRTAFYERLIGEGDEYRPNYPDLLKKNDFIRVPRLPKDAVKVGRGAHPGRHGAIRLAAKQVLEGQQE